MHSLCCSSPSGVPGSADEFEYQTSKHCDNIQVIRNRGLPCPEKRGQRCQLVTSLSGGAFKERKYKMYNRKKRVCPVEIAGSLDNRLRRWIQNPRKLLSHYIKEGMTVLDLGCGPGFFSIDVAQMVGKSGRVIACDLQEGMLRKLSKKIQGTKLEEQVVLHKCEHNRIGWNEKVDFVLAFYVVHEIPNQEELFKELKSIVKSTGQVLIVEPMFHVSKSAMAETVRKAQNAGFKAVDGPKVIFSKAVMFRKP
jgi:SAM-dependent methyltransferase